MKIHPVGAKLINADGQTDRWTDMTKVTGAFSNFANASRSLSFDKLQFRNNEM